jgi:hypothetical protein
MAHEGERIAARHAAQFSSEEIHRALFPDGAPEPQTADEMKQGIRRRMRERYARHRHRRSGSAHYP